MNPFTYEKTRNAYKDTKYYKSKNILHHLNYLLEKETMPNTFLYINILNSGIWIPLLKTKEILIELQNS